MLKQLLSFFFIIFTVAGQAQTNLVPNGSFEDTISCPINTGEVSKCKFWYDPTQCSSDYFNSCNNYNYVSVPQNFAGFQHAHTGNAYAGFYAFVKSYSTSVREAIAVELTESLKKDSSYCISFFASLADSMYYAVNQISVAFFNSRYYDSTCSFNNIQFIPQFNSNIGFIKDKINWTKISGVYKAFGNEKFIVISNFQSNINIDTLQLYNGGSINDNNVASYYYIDDISIINCNNPDISIPNIITPNGDAINDTFFIKNLDENTSVEIYNRWGYSIYKNFNYDNNWYPKELSDGIYYYIIKTNNNTYKGFIEIVK